MITYYMQENDLYSLKVKKSYKDGSYDNEVYKFNSQRIW